jgi:hypothetical protein
MAMPLLRTASTSTLCTMSAVWGSSVPVGSSARNRMGSLASCRASTHLCFSPPDRSLAICVTRWSSLTNFKSSSARSIFSFSGIRSSSASKMFSMTVISPKRAKVLCSMMAIRLRICDFRGSSSSSAQKSTSLICMSLPHLPHLAPSNGSSVQPQAEQELNR